MEALIPTLTETRDVETFARTNKGIIRSWIVNRLHNVSQVEDIWQHMLYRLLKYKLLDKFDPTSSSYKTYISMTLHGAITNYQNKTRTGKICKDHNHDIHIDRTVDITNLEVEMNDEDVGEIEAKYDIFKFFSWYKRKRMRKIWKTDTDIEILKHIMLGMTLSEIALKLNITVQAVSQSRIKMRTLYKAWLKQVSLEDSKKRL